MSGGHRRGDGGCGDHEHRLAPNESVEFATCSQDAGVVWQVTNQSG